MEKFSLRLIEGFLRWYLNTHNDVRKSAFQTLARYFSMFCNKERSQETPYETKLKLKWVRLPISLTTRLLLIFSARERHSTGSI